MSQLSDKDKETIRKIVEEESGNFLEIFPGNEGEGYDSTELLFEILGIEGVSIGDGEYPANNNQHISVRVPPWPKLERKFNYIFMNELCWLLDRDSQTPEGIPIMVVNDDAVDFVVSAMSKKGKFILTETHDFEFERFYKRLAKKHSSCKIRVEQVDEVFVMTLL